MGVSNPHQEAHELRYFKLLAWLLAEIFQVSYRCYILTLFRSERLRNNLFPLGSCSAKISPAVRASLRVCSA